MQALRFILIGYGIALLAGAAMGAAAGPVSGGLAFWLGGGVLSVWIAERWYGKQRQIATGLEHWDRDLDAERIDADLRLDRIRPDNSHVTHA